MKSASDVRCAFRRLGNAVLRGAVDPKVANSAMYAVAGAARALEIELTEEAVRVGRALLVRRPEATPQDGELLESRLQLSAPSDPNGTEDKAETTANNGLESGTETNGPSLLTGADQGDHAAEGGDLVPGGSSGEEAL